MAEMAEKEHRPAEAVELLKAAISAGEGVPWFVFPRLAGNLRDIGRHDDALMALSGIEGVPDKQLWRVDMWKGQVYGAMKNYPAAIEHHTRALEMHPARTMNYIFLGAIYSYAQEQEKALEVLLRGLDAEGDRDEVYLNIGLCHRTNGEYGLAEEALKKALDITPAYPEAETVLRDVKAAQIALEMRKSPISKKDFMELYEKAKKADNEDRHAEAAELFKTVSRGVESMPSFGWFRLGENLRLIGRFDEAEEIFASIDDVPEKWQWLLFTHKGGLHLDQGDFQRAFYYFEQAVENHPQGTKPYVCLASAYAAVQEPKKAIEVLLRGLETEGSFDDVHADLGVNYRTSGEYVLARDAFAKALELSPAYPGAEEGLKDVSGALCVLEMLKE